MRVELSQAFEKAAGVPCLDISLPGPVSLRELLELLARERAFFAKYLSYQDDALLGAHLSVFCAGRLLKLDDAVDDGDTVKLFLPVTGG
ncbi:MoaD/ThiS family protein [Desulfoferula mesophila]|uniref:MoaD/ThiS family protein n=1 Tax=Desulfoferula mesophila TaxID=3058419 RepID=A0AAU9ECG1_9BACT|nr:hypothetical protein FAK_16160 [Desulfoferula mesophilus]